MERRMTIEVAYGCGRDTTGTEPASHVDHSWNAPALVSRRGEEKEREAESKQHLDDNAETPQLTWEALAPSPLSKNTPGRGHERRECRASSS